MSDQDCSVRQWSATPALVTALWTGFVAAAAWCATLWIAGGDAPGRLIAGVTGLGLLGWAVFATRARPRLRVDSDGVTVRGLVGARHVPWPFVEQVHVVRHRRFGRDVAMLEIDATSATGDDQLMVFGRFDLGADPGDVAPLVEAARPQNR